MRRRAVRGSSAGNDGARLIVERGGNASFAHIRPVNRVVGNVGRHLRFRALDSSVELATDPRALSRERIVIDWQNPVNFRRCNICMAGWPRHPSDAEIQGSREFYYPRCVVTPVYVLILFDSVLLCDARLLPGSCFSSSDRVSISRCTTQAPLPRKRAASFPFIVSKR